MFFFKRLLFQPDGEEFDLLITVIFKKKDKKDPSDNTEDRPELVNKEALA